MNNDFVNDIEGMIQKTKKEILNKEEKLEQLLSQIEEQDNQENNMQ